MTPRQARTERRAAERKAKKAEIRRNKQLVLEHDDDLPLEEEFSPDEIASARAAAASIEREVALKMAAHRAALDQNRDCQGAVTTPRLLQCEPEWVHDPALIRRIKAQCKADTNRENAAHSTGPRTSSGKLASSRNSLKHGLTSGHLILPDEDISEFESLLASLLDEHQPSGPTEEILVNEMAQSYWLSQRAIRLQNDCFTNSGTDEKRLSLYMRYHSTHQRAFHKALTALMKLKKEQARGFVSQSAKRVPAKSGFVPQTVTEPITTSPESEFVPQKDRAEAA